MTLNKFPFQNGISLTVLLKIMYLKTFKNSVVFQQQQQALFA